MGKYGEDNEFVPGRDLDQFNGRFTKTPEFPNGVYAYFITIDSVGEPITAMTNEADVLAVRQNLATAINSANISNTYDVNKDGRVNAMDTSIVRQNQLSSLIRLFTAPVSLKIAVSPTSLKVANASVPNLEASHLLSPESNPPLVVTTLSVLSEKEATQRTGSPSYGVMRKLFGTIPKAHG